MMQQRIVWWRMYLNRKEFLSAGMICNAIVTHRSPLPFITFISFSPLFSLKVYWFTCIYCSIYVVHFFFFFFLIYCLNDACRYYLVEKAKDANVIGILVGTLGVGKFLCGIERDRFVWVFVVYSLLTQIFFVLSMFHEL